LYRLIHDRKEALMAIVLEAHYSKKLGLPGYSSHQYGVTIRAELSDINLVPQESERIYRLLQNAFTEALKGNLNLLPARTEKLHRLLDIQAGVNRRVAGENSESSQGRPRSRVSRNAPTSRRGVSFLARLVDQTYHPFIAPTRLIESTAKKKDWWSIRIRHNRSGLIDVKTSGC
jgi:hypothetical protein